MVGCGGMEIYHHHPLASVPVSHFSFFFLTFSYFDAWDDPMLVTDDRYALYILGCLVIICAPLFLRAANILYIIIMLCMNLLRNNYSSMVSGFTIFLDIYWNCNCNCNWNWNWNCHAHAHATRSARES